MGTDGDHCTWVLMGTIHHQYTAYAHTQSIQVISYVYLKGYPNRIVCTHAETVCSYNTVIKGGPHVHESVPTCNGPHQYPHAMFPISTHMQWSPSVPTCNGPHQYPHAMVPISTHMQWSPSVPTCSVRVRVLMYCGA